MKSTKKLIQETKAIIRLHAFLRYECGLKEADKLTAKDLLYLKTLLENKEKRVNFLK